MAAMDGKLAIIFPGQGSQTPDMRDAVERHRPDLLAMAAELVGDDPFERIDEGTRFAQPAIYCASIARWEALGRPQADACAGHSLGELAALVAAGAMSTADGLWAAIVRGRLMHESVSQGEAGGMMAVRATEGEARAVAARHGVMIANVNDPRQVVLSGSLRALAAVREELQRSGVRAKPLPIAGAFHSPALARAVEPFRAALERIRFAPARVPVLRSATATPFVDPPAELASALLSPVQWIDVMRALYQRGVRRFLEPGPGRVLTGLVRRSLHGVDARSVDELEAVRA